MRVFQNTNVSGDDLIYDGRIVKHESEITVPDAVGDRLAEQPNNWTEVAKAKTALRSKKPVTPVEPVPEAEPAVESSNEPVQPDPAPSK